VCAVLKGEKQHTKVIPDQEKGFKISWLNIFKMVDPIVDCVYTNYLELSFAQVLSSIKICVVSLNINT